QRIPLTGDHVPQLRQSLHRLDHRVQHLGLIAVHRSSSSTSATSTLSPCSWASEMTSLSAFQVLVRFSSGTPSPVIVHRILFFGPIAFSSRFCSRIPGHSYW